MPLIIEIEETPGSGIWVDIRSRFTNSVGTPVVSADPNDTGAGIAGVYTLTFEDVTPGDSATVKILTSSPDNPYRDTTGKSVDLDGATAYRNIVGGVDLVFSDDGDFDATWEAEIRIGYSFGPVAAFGATAGRPTDSRRIRVRNDESESENPEAARNVRAVIAKHAKLFPTAGAIFEAMLDFAPGATEKITDGQAQPYAITVENKTGTGSAITADIKVDGELVNVRDQDGTESTSEALAVVNVYTIIEGDLTGLQFQLSEFILNTATANILIFNARFTQTAPDLGGAPGDWGNADVFIQSDGEEEGTIAADGFGFFHVRLLAPDGSISGSNPYPIDVMIVAEASTPAGWNS